MLNVGLCLRTVNLAGAHRGKVHDAVVGILFKIRYVYVRREGRGRESRGGGVGSNIYIEASQSRNMYYICGTKIQT
jgi:hypothetical protein